MGEMHAAVLIAGEAERLALWTPLTRFSVGR